MFEKMLGIRLWGLPRPSNCHSVTEVLRAVKMQELATWCSIPPVRHSCYCTVSEKFMAFNPETVAVIVMPPACEEVV
jgi:hypothetical protein